MAVKSQDRISCSFVYKVVCIDNKFIKKSFLYRGKNAADELVKAILKEMIIEKK